MVDVRPTPKVVGPIDELRLLTVADFRRLDPNPRRAAGRVREKIKLLEDESYAAMVEGVRAWRTSPLNALYVSLGQQSLAARKSVADVIRARRTAGTTTLSEEEFEALLDLNQQLRF
jgi:2-oxo-4-hydroxy-4-carboxy--5-ureidoimidazoline (OHCU) decarboxylase